MSFSGIDGLSGMATAGQPIEYIIYCLSFGVSQVEITGYKEA